ncbi:hypothetical protein MTO96_020334 [Rhipicephalus appendiculatus]
MTSEVAPQSRFETPSTPSCVMNYVSSCRLRNPKFLHSLPSYGTRYNPWEQSIQSIRARPHHRFARSQDS